MIVLEPGYTAEVDRISKAEWHALLLEFDDANFYQTWSYGERLWGWNNISHLVLRYDGRPVAMAQLRVLGFPILRGGVAYLNWGPLWKHRAETEHAGHLRNMVRALLCEYVERRKLAIRVLPKIIETDANRFVQRIFLDEGYRQSPDPSRTFVVNLDATTDEIRRNMHRSWKRSLKFAEKQGLVIKEVADKEQYAEILDVYSQMKSRKRFFGNTQREVLRIHEDLPDPLKLKILLCFHQGEVIAALGWSNLGKTCIPLIGATGDQGLRFKASFLLWWEMIQSSQRDRAEYCDMATVHEKRNPGGHFFKQGLAGKDAREVTYIGRYDAYRGRAAFLVIRAAMVIRGKAINTARRLKMWRRS